MQHVHGTCMCFNVHQTVYLYGWTVRAGQIGRTADGRHVCHLAASHDTVESANRYRHILMIHVTSRPNHVVVLVV